MSVLEAFGVIFSLQLTKVLKLELVFLNKILFQNLVQILGLPQYNIIIDGHWGSDRCALFLFSMSRTLGMSLIENSLSYVGSQL